MSIELAEAPGAEMWAMGTIGEEDQQLLLTQTWDGARRRTIYRGNCRRSAFKKTGLLEVSVYSQPAEMPDVMDSEDRRKAWKPPTVVAQARIYYAPGGQLYYDTTGFEVSGALPDIQWNPDYPE